MKIIIDFMILFYLKKTGFAIDKKQGLGARGFLRHIRHKFILQTNIFIEPIVNFENISVKCDGLREKNI
ncbi:MAG: hypothetical protein A2452_01350 [Candidatus Firestonebacteria bacterium RIFOXYC2_FULL_39_67]|nr:MAG: hypothetical protein A2536_06090 [Candidatus Firestonebacteria bacterium RIFOXYD2_FULL_39_29]OGF52783.1 MAG: hypothetical protein A2497_01160 [Candidatus Firestonebacteria bacterium RifOxyC12_full_39_7]OGF54881.1 MAG: hypothetical protein A2452_01350 [Candidatus Firestonebacteria bacterium RIFOXYC2_FULL_39_67]